MIFFISSTCPSQINSKFSLHLELRRKKYKEGSIWKSCKVSNEMWYEIIFLQLSWGIIFLGRNNNTGWVGSHDYWSNLEQGIKIYFQRVEDCWILFDVWCWIIIQNYLKSFIEFLGRSQKLLGLDTLNFTKFIYLEVFWPWSIAWTLPILW